MGPAKTEVALSQTENPRILVRLTNWIGDIVMNLPGLECLRRAYPKAEISVLLRPHLASLAEFRPDLIDAVIPFEDKGRHRGLSGLWSLGTELRGRFDIGVAFTKHFKGAFLLRAAKIPVRVGFYTPETRIFLNRGVPFSRLPKTGRHQSLNYVDLVVDMLPEPPEHAPRPRLFADASRVLAMREKYLSGLPGPHLLVHAGASYGTAKRWLPERFAEVCGRWHQETGGGVVLLGVPAEAEVNQTIAELVGASCLDLCGRTSLSESLHLISGAQAFLSNDSGLMHVAGAFSVPQVAVYGPTDVEATYPLNAKATTIREKVPCSPCFKRHCPEGFGHVCMTGVEADRVGEALLEQHRKGCSELRSS